jgi:hypothetical protein
MKKLLALVLAVLLTGCATTGRDRAVNAHIADVSITAAALALLPVIELNPLGPIIPLLKYAEIKAIEAEPEATVRAELYIKSAAFTNSANANNVCVFVTMSPGCLVVGVIYGFYDYHQNMQPEKFYEVFCEEWKKEKEGNTCAPFNKESQ